MSQKIYKPGLTLIELLVAISVLTIVTALIIPRLRIVNKERNIREAARLVGGIFSAARDRAVASGCAGVAIERNLNFVKTTSDGNRVYFAGSRLYQLRSLPLYTGDSNSDFAFSISTTDAFNNPTVRVYIPLPIEHEPNEGRPLFRRGDRIGFDEDSTEAPFVITDVLPPEEISFNVSTTSMINGKDLSASNGNLVMLPLDISFDNDNTIGNALDTSMVDYISSEPCPAFNLGPPYDASTLNFEPILYIKRLRRLESSVINLPAGYLIDMRYSGPIDVTDPTFEADEFGSDDAETVTLFGVGLPVGIDENSPDNREIQIHFDNTGSLDQVVHNGNTVSLIQTLYLFINEFDPNLSLDFQTNADSVLANPDNLWVTVGMNGGINIGYNAPAATGGVDTMITSSRSISRARASADQ